MQPQDSLGYWLGRAVRSVGGALFVRMRAHCVERGKPYVITPPQFGVLAILAAHGEQTVTALGQQLVVETPAITGMVTRLEQNGLVERVRDAEDRRSVKVSVTNEGRDIMGTLLPIMAALNEELLPRAHRQELLQQLQAIIDRASAMAPGGAGLASFLPAMQDFQHPEEP